MSELEDLRKRCAEAEAKAEWFRCAHILIANEYAFVGQPEAGMFFAMAGIKDGVPTLALNMGDVFFWGTADAESFHYADAPKMLEIAKKDGYTGLIKWCMEQRLARDESFDNTHLEKYSGEKLKLLARAEKAEKALTEALAKIGDLQYELLGEDL